MIIKYFFFLVLIVSSVSAITFDGFVIAINKVETKVICKVTRDRTPHNQLWAVS